MEPTGHEENAYEATGSTSKGIKSRDCPCCKKQMKMEVMGAHVKKVHPVEYNAFFTVPCLTDCIEKKGLVRFKVEYDDKDTQFLHCFACVNIRTTDRGHFKDNQTHLDEHLDIATQMLSKKTGVAFIPAAIGDVEKLRRKLFNITREYAQSRKACDDEHGQYDAHNAINLAEITRLTEEVATLKKELTDSKAESKWRGDCVHAMTFWIKNIRSQIPGIREDVGQLYSESKAKYFNSACVKIATLANKVDSYWNSTSAVQRVDDFPPEPAVSSYEFENAVQ